MKATVSAVTVVAEEVVGMGVAMERTMTTNVSFVS